MNSQAARLPNWPMMIIPLVLSGAVVMAGLARQSGFATNAPPAPVATAYLLQFGDLPDGSVAVYNAADKHLIMTVPPREGGFLRSTVRSLDGVRARENIGEYAPFKLTVLADQHLELTDTATGQMIDLEAFGHTNEAEFRAISLAAGAAP
jgi:putative photosynthetic complex assembly protein